MQAWLHLLGLSKSHTKEISGKTGKTAERTFETGLLSLFLPVRTGENPMEEERQIFMSGRSRLNNNACLPQSALFADLVL
jgi:hypothetical protein